MTYMSQLIIILWLYVGGWDGPAWFLKFASSLLSRLFLGRKTCFIFMRSWHRRWLLDLFLGIDRPILSNTLEDLWGLRSCSYFGITLSFLCGKSFAGWLEVWFVLFYIYFSFNRSDLPPLSMRMSHLSECIRLKHSMAYLPLHLHEELMHGGVLLPSLARRVVVLPSRQCHWWDWRWLTLVWRSSSSDTSLALLIRELSLLELMMD